MITKKVIQICCLAMMVVMTGCTSNISQSDGNESGSEKEIETTNTIENNEKTLVVYYSATGSTKNVAETIAKVTNADLFEIEPVESYTEDDLNWRNSDSRVSKEHEDESLRDVELVSTSVENWESYNTVYIGYPIWWGISAWPVNRFVKENDFTGKTVIPFCTSASSDIGDSGNLLEEMASTGEWKEGRRFQGNISEDEIIEWIDELKF